MSQALELARYTVKPENVDAMLASHTATEAALQTFPGFINIHFGRLDSTTFLDVCLWESRAQAEAAAAKAPEHPDLSRTFALIDEVLGFEHADLAEPPAAASSR